DGTSVDFAGKDLTSGAAINRTLTGVAAGAVSATSVDAINGSQLHGTAQSVADAIGGGSTVAADGTITAPTYNIGGVDRDNVGDALANLDQRATSNSDGLQDLGDKLVDTGLVDASGNTKAAVVYDQNTDGTPNFGSVTFGDAATGPTQLKNVAAATDDTDAVNFNQLKDYVATNAAADPLAVAYTDATKGEIALAGTGGTVISGVKAGEVSATSDEAINGSQLHGTAQSVADAIGGGAAVGTDGTISAPSFTIGGSAYDNVGDAFGAVDTSLGDLDGRVTRNEGDITTINTQIGGLTNGTVGLVQQAAAGQKLTVGKDTDGTSVDFAGKDLTSGAAINRTLTGVAAGAVSATSVDAINGSQLHGTAQSVANAIGGGSAVAADGKITAPTYNIGGVNRDNVGDALANLDQRATDNSDGLQDLGDKLADTGLVDASGNSRAAVVYDQNTDGTPNYGSVTFGDAATGPVRLKNVANGVDAGDAVNMSQLTAVSNAAATANPYIAGRGANATNAARAVGLNSVSLGSGSVSSEINTVSVGNATSGLVRRITNVDDGQARTDAATVGQLNDLVVGTTARTQQQLNTFDSRLSALGMSTQSAVDDAFLKIDGQPTDDVATVTAGTNAIAMGSGANSTGSFSVALGAASEATGTSAVAIGAEAKATANGALAMGRSTASGGSAVALGNGTIASGNNALAAGFNANATGTNALALGNTSQALADNAIAVGATANVNAAATNAIAFGRGATVAAAGVNSIALGAGSLADRANAVSVGSSAQQRQIINLAEGTSDSDAVNFGQLKQYVAANGGSGGAGNALAVAYADAGKDSIALEGAAGTVISNVKAGEVSATSSEATNGSQLHGTAQSVADALGGGSVVNPDGSVSAPSYQIGGTDYTNVGDSFKAVDDSLTSMDGRVTQNEGDITNLDARVTTNTTDITNINNQLGGLATGTVGLVQQAAPGAGLTVGKDTDGDNVNFAGTAGARKLSGVANGVDDADVATMAQVKAMGLIDPNNGRALAALVYDDVSLARATLGGTNGTIIGNLGDGLIAAGSREAVNGGQLWKMNADLEARWSDLDSRVGTIEKGVADGSIGGGNGAAPGTGTGIGAPGVGDGSLVIGDGSKADGDGAIGVGRGSDASGDGSVAIGDGATATGKDSIAIGKGSTADGDNEFSVGSEGNERVIRNVAAGSLPTDAVNMQQMDDRFKSERQYTDTRFQAVDKRMDRMGAISAAYAGMALNTAGLEGDNRVGAGLGNQNGRAALAVGYQRILGEKKNVSVSLGGAFSGSERSVTAGAGFSW
ncbi:YadA-like family protein, partial [Stenotrophomonas sp. C3(2023)]|uniref:YadA family autotransporter adhesin n=1 Tax=Stenotrophomonas sp. C3(2023) TaxID=3080277 RepID=UPI00293D132A